MRPCADLCRGRGIDGFRFVPPAPRPYALERCVGGAPPGLTHDYVSLSLSIYISLLLVLPLSLPLPLSLSLSRSLSSQALHMFWKQEHCISRASKPGLIDNNDVFNHQTIDASASALLKNRTSSPRCGACPGASQAFACFLLRKRWRAETNGTIASMHCRDPGSNRGLQIFNLALSQLSARGMGEGVPSRIASASKKQVPAATATSM